MPKERICQSSQGDADLLVSWEPQDRSEYRYVTLWPTDRPLVTEGYFAFHPTGSSIEKMGPDPVSPVRIDLDREQINRLILALRRARNAVYGKDE